jgi:hypothetical protein
MWNISTRFGEKLGKIKNRMKNWRIIRMVEAKPKMDPKAKALAFVFILLIIGVLAGFIISKVSLDSTDIRTKTKIVVLRGNINLKDENLKQINRILATQIWSDFSDIFTIVTIFISINLALLLGILVYYIDGFRRTKSNFMLGLILFLGVLFLQALLSLPPLQLALGQSVFDIGIFNILPNLFETIALMIFFYLGSG